MIFDSIMGKEIGDIMLEYKIVDAKDKDIEILSSIKLVTMVDNEMDKALSFEEKSKLRKNVLKDIKKTFEYYKLIYVNKTIAGAYCVIPYENGYMIDELYLFEEYRNNGIGASILSRLKKEIPILFVWVYQNNKKAIKFFETYGFINIKNGRTIIMKYDSLYDTIKEKLKDVKMGYVDKEGNKYLGYNRNFKELFYLQSPKQLLESKVGTCFEQVELEREEANKLGVDYRTYYMTYPDDNYDISHTFLIYKDHKKYYWVENAWFLHRGLHIYDSKEALLNDVISKFVKTIDKGEIKKVKLYVYDKPRYGISYAKYLAHCVNGKSVRYR